MRHLGPPGAQDTTDAVSRVGAGDKAQATLVLVTGTVAMVFTCAYQYGLPALLPGMVRGGLTLLEASMLVAAPIAGLVAGLVAWGAVADRWGERVALGYGMAMAASALAAAAASDAPAAMGAWLVVAGTGGSATHVTTGRLILAWFPPRQRGRAMAIRQTGQPLGVAVAMLALPALAASGGLSLALGVLAAACAAAGLVAVTTIHPSRRRARENSSPTPYRSPFLWRLHAASALLVIPQFAVSTFAFDYLVRVAGWPVVRAGAVLAAAQVSGAAVRWAAGWWSDHLGRRLRPMRQLALTGAVCMGVLALTVPTPSTIAVNALLVALPVTVSPNGLAFTAVAERAGAGWAGRTLGVHNTAQNLVAAGTPPLLALLIAGRPAVGQGYAIAFAVALAAATLATGLIPASTEAALVRR